VIAPATATMTPGTNGESRLATTMTNATAQTCHAPGWRSTSQATASGLPVPARTPSTAGSWEPMISRPAAAVKPSITGCDIRYASRPPLTRPSSTRQAPTSSASSAASAAYSAPPIGANPLSVPSTSSAVPAVGPVCRYGEEPHNAPAIGASAAA
jgi:hypothetical protein